MNISLNDPQESQQMKAIQALYSVIDPELFVNVVDLGLIYDLNFETPGKIAVRMTLSTPHCPMGDAITSGVRRALEAEFTGMEAIIDLSFDPPWSFEMLTDAGRAQLGV